MAEEQVLDFEPSPRLEQVDAEHSERMQERKHRSRSCDDSTRRCERLPPGSRVSRRDAGSTALCSLLKLAGRSTTRRPTYASAYRNWLHRELIEFALLKTRSIQIPFSITVV